MCARGDQSGACAGRRGNELHRSRKPVAVPCTRAHPGPEEHAYVLDLELYGEVDDKDVKQASKGGGGGGARGGGGWRRRGSAAEWHPTHTHVPASPPSLACLLAAHHRALHHPGHCQEGPRGGVLASVAQGGGQPRQEHQGVCVGVGGGGTHALPTPTQHPISHPLSHPCEHRWTGIGGWMRMRWRRQRRRGGAACRAALTSRSSRWVGWWAGGGWRAGCGAGVCLCPRPLLPHPQPPSP